MKKHIFRKKRSHRSQLAGLALVAILAVFPSGGVQGETYSVGPGKSYSNLKSFSQSVALYGNNDIIDIYGDDRSLLEPLPTSMMPASGTVLLQSGDGAEWTIRYGGLKSVNSRVVDLDRGHFIFGENLIFTGSNQRYDGGVGLVSGIGTISTTGSTFTDNTADGNGGVFFNDGATLKIGASMFFGNVANFGGMLYAEGGTTTITDSGIIGNSAGNGGAVYQHGGTLNIFDTTIAGNVASSPSFQSLQPCYGGALYLEAATVNLKNVNFYANTAQNAGGAVYVSGDMTLTIGADAGKTSVWSGNQDNYDSPNGSNSIFFDMDTAVTQQLSVFGDGDVLMYDSIRAAKTQDLNNKLVIRKWGDGGWYLGGDSVLSGTGVTLSTSMGISGGTFGLMKEATITVQQGDFRLRDGATLAVNGYNMIAVLGDGIQKAITLETGSTIRVNMEGWADENAAMLTLVGEVYDPAKDRNVADISVDKITVDVTGIDATNGNYTLVFAPGADFSTATLLIDGREWVNDPAYDRRGSRSFDVTAKNTIVLKLSGIDINRTVYWNGADGDVWSEIDAHWSNNQTGSKYFLNGDIVVFGGNAAAREVVVASDGVRFDTLYADGDYAFTGGELSGNQIVYRGEAELTFDSRQLGVGIAVEAGSTAGLVAGDGQTLDVTRSGGGAAVSSGNGAMFNLGRLGGTGTIRFLDNENSDRGGAFVGQTIRLLGGENIMQGNATAADGGAIWAVNVGVLGGSASFTDNAADGLGGAIYATGTVVLAAKDGDILFSGNTAGGEANAVYMENVSGGSLQMTAAAGRTIEFFDPVENRASGAGDPAFAVSISGAGTVRFDQYRSNIRGVTNVNGTLLLTGAAAYGAETGNEEFFLNTGAVLATEGPGNVVSADTIRIAHGATVRVDLNGADATGGTASLTLDGNVTTGAGDTFNLDVLVASQDGKFLVLASENYDFDGRVVEVINGTPIDVDSPNDRYGTRQFVYELGEIYLELGDYDINRTVTWSGVDGVWSENSADWNVSGTTKKYFLNGDTVVFGNNDQPETIRVASGGVLVAGMTVSGDYTFTGGDISAVQDDTVRTLTKNGFGTLTLNQRNVFGLVNIAEGTLAGGTSSLETIRGDLMIAYGAGLSPGTGGAGTFRVTGNVDFQAGSYLYLDLGTTQATSDQLIVTSGAVDFASDTAGTVTIVVAGNGVGLGESTTDRSVVTADGGLLLNGGLLSDGVTEAGSETITLRNGGAAKIVIQSDGSLDLQSAAISGGGTGLAISAMGLDAPVPPASRYTRNQLSALNSIQNASTSTFANQLMAKFALTADADKPAYLEALLPTINSAMPLVTQRAVSQFRQVNNERLRHLNADHPHEYRRLLDGERLRNSAKKEEGKTLGQRYCANAAPTIWMHNYGDFLHQGSKHVQAYDSDSYGIAMGTERWLGRETVVGLGFGGAFANAKTKDHSQRADANTFVFSPYVSHTTRDGIKILASIGYAYNDYEITRHPGGVRLDSTHNGNVFLLNGEVSKRLRGSWTDVTPFYSLELIYLDEQGYAEYDAAGTAVAAVKGRVTDSWLSTMGVRLGRTRTNRFGWLVNPSVTLGWICDFGDGTIHTTSSYAGGTPFITQGSSMSRNRFLMGLNYAATVNQRMSFFGGYNSELGDRYGAHTIQAGFTFEF